MLKRTILCVYFFLVALSAFPQDEGVFWKISGNDLRSSSYLFGTIHLMCENDFQISDQVSKRLGLAEALVMELDLDDPALYGSMMENMYNEDGQKITDFLSETEYVKIREFLKERTGMDMDQMQRMRPMVLMSLIYPNLLECETMAFESELMQLAKENDISVHGLESVDEQLGFFDQIPLKEQYRSFFNYTENLEKGKEEFRKLLSSYQEEDIAQLLELVSESPEYKDYKNILVDQRNENWIKTMGTLMQQGTMFFAVGAGHLAGENGLIRLLKKEGYYLERVYL